MERTKIVIVTQYFPPEIGGGAHRTVGLAEELAALGSAVTVVAPYPSYLIRDGDRRWKFRLFEKVRQPGYDVFRLFVIATDRRTFFKRIIYYLSFALSTLLLFLVELKEADVVLTISPPLFTGIAGVAAKRLRGCRFFLDIGDLWTDAAVQLRLLRGTRSIRWARRLERWIYRNADGINLVTPGTYERFLGDRSLNARISLVPNFVDTGLIRKHERDTGLADRLGLTGKMVFGYTGNIGHAQGIQTIVEAARLTRDVASVAYVIVGDGVERPEVDSLIRRYALENVLLLPPVARDEVPVYMNLLDVMIIPLVKAELFTQTIPSKLYEAMAAEVPVLLCVDGEARRLVETVGCGVYVEPEEPSRLAAAVLDCYRDPDRIRQMGPKGRAIVEERFAMNKVVRKFWKELQHSETAPAGAPLPDSAVALAGAEPAWPPFAADSGEL